MNNAWSLEKKTNIGERISYGWNMVVATGWFFWSFAGIFSGVFYQWFISANLTKRIIAEMAILAYLAVVYNFPVTSIIASALVFMISALLVCYSAGKVVTEVGMWESSCDRY